MAGNGTGRPLIFRRTGGDMTIEDIIENRLPVFVVTLSDDCGLEDRIGAVGTVVGQRLDPVGSGDEPYLEVRFADDKVDCFWPEELRLVFS